MRFQAPRGTEDILPGTSEAWVWLENRFRQECDLYGYREIRTPTFEDTALFQRLGQGSDVVSKEMYDFLDRGGRSMTLKPEGTAPAIRAYIEHSLGGQGAITKLFYITPVFRYGRPQKGRLRESHQVGIELIGPGGPEADVEIIEFTSRFYRSLDLQDVVVSINSIGQVACRERYCDALLAFATPLLKDMPPEARLNYEQNPLRMLDTKDETLKARLLEAPDIGDYLEPESKTHFESVLAGLSALNVRYEVDKRLVRGLDYYTKTVFEVLSFALGAQSALCGGGRYDGLVRECGGADTPAVGVAMGIERALLVLADKGKVPSAAVAPGVFCVCLTENRLQFLKLLQAVRDRGLRAESDLDFRSAKSQFRQADKSGAEFAIVLGDDELAANVVTLRELSNGEESKLPLNEAISRVAGK
jgi:histidyl-tRNA synthetase